MNNVIRWRCPFCNQHATITENDRDASVFEFVAGDPPSKFTLASSAIRCPNEHCHKYSLTASLYQQHNRGSGAGAPNWGIPDTVANWNLIPDSKAKPIPDYVPAPIREDYREACLIVDRSPKAAATLARRCLQGMIRDFWGIKKGRLKDEIDALEDRVDPLTWKAIDGVRTIGNIGAHMEKEIDHIVEVDEDEAELLVGLIESLIEDWYEARHDRELRMREVIATAEKKEAERLAPVETAPEE